MTSKIALTAARPVKSWGVAAIAPIMARPMKIEATARPSAAEFPPGRAPLAPAAMAALIHAQAVAHGPSVRGYGYARAA